ncbi:hypothetical protein [Ascidiaceihabitans sp.]|uniref:hypothetical protein n=1 Tax=Ascidiaceihabitans sp. TaxID=1872644 RepID=UPI003299FB53
MTSVQGGCLCGDVRVTAHGALDDPNQFTPTYQLWTKRREHWLPEMDNLISYDEDRTGD